MYKIIFILLSLTIGLSACKEPASTRNAKTVIVCTTGMIGDAIRAFAGSEAEVITLMGPGVDPHLYKATQGDLKKLNRADIIVYNGLHLEGKMGEVFEKLSQRKKVYALAELLDKKDLIKTDETNYDPHIWFDVHLWGKALTLLSQKIHHDFPSLKSWKSNSTEYLKEFPSLDSTVHAQIASIPATQRVLITAHDAFSYFGKRYEIEVRALQGISTLSEFGLKDITELVSFISHRKIKAVFVESSVSSKSIESVIEGCKSNGHEVSLGGTLFSDALGAENSSEGTYKGMVRYNTQTIAGALR